MDARGDVFVSEKTQDANKQKIRHVGFPSSIYTILSWIAIHNAWSTDAHQKQLWNWNSRFKLN